jgi:lysozyme family protein
VEQLQQALVNLSKTNLPVAHPGPVDGIVGTQTLIAIGSILPSLVLDQGFKATLVQLFQAAAVEGAEWAKGVFASLLEGEDAGARAKVIQSITSNAPALTTSVNALTQQRSAQTPTQVATTPGAVSALTRERAARLVQHGAMAPQKLAPQPRVAKPWYKNWKVLVPVGVGAVALAGVGWWLLK